MEEARRRAVALWDYSKEHLVVIRDEKFYPFVKFEIIATILCCLLDLLTNKHQRTVPGPIKSTESCCQQGKGLINYLELSKENVLGNIMLSHWPWFTWNFFMIWFTKFLNWFFRNMHHVLEMYVLNIEEKYLSSQFSWPFYYTLKTTIL